MNNCTDCLYAEESTSFVVKTDFLYKCQHENSPYYNELVFDTQSCRYFVDYENYIKLKDRKEAIINLINKSR